MAGFGLAYNAPAAAVTFFAAAAASIVCRAVASLINAHPRPGLAGHVMRWSGRVTRGSVKFFGGVCGAAGSRLIMGPMSSQAGHPSASRLAIFVGIWLGILVVAAAGQRRGRRLHAASTPGVQTPARGRQLNPPGSVPPAPGRTPADLHAVTRRAQDSRDCSLILVSPGLRRIPVVKAVRTLTGMPLGPAWDLVDGAPWYVLQNVTSEQADRAKDLLESLGATVTVSSESSQVQPQS